MAPPIDISKKNEWIHDKLLPTLSLTLQIQKYTLVSDMAKGTCFD